MNSKLLGGILLVIGTTIGAGILALPVVTAQLGFWGSVFLFTGCWAMMLACAYLFLEVNLWFPPNSNFISMAGATLGRPGQVVAWVLYLFLLYCILCAYVSGGGDLFHYLLGSAGINISLGAGSILFTFLFGIIVYCGIRSVDYVNRGLMLGKLGALILSIVLITPFISGNYLDHGQIKYIISPLGLTSTAVAFGSLMIIPSLRTYFGEDIKSLRKAIFIGMTIPLLCYIAWNMVISGVVPYNGAHGLKQIMQSSNQNSDLIVALASLLQNNSTIMLVKFFMTISMTTSFLSISLSLVDFLADGLGREKKGLSNIIIFSAAFGPPVLGALFYSDAFLRGLQYAGLSTFVLMVLMPPLMVWRGRYHQGIQSAYQVGGGKVLLLGLMVFATVLIVLGLEGTLF